MPAQSSFDKEMEKGSHLLKCLADKNRLSVFAILTHGSYTVSDIYRCLRLKQNLISHHLKILKAEKLATSEKLGREIYYSLNKEKLKELDKILGRILQASRGSAKFN
ncbi:MAG: metalloregulator ArsR/SmtB family transcription factor [bacterium]|nr:metalloregulator ArsR/SmtB family transcription factor [bacterium]